MVARAPSREALQQFFAGDPYARQGLAEHRILEFEPLLHQPWLEDWLTREPA